MLAAVLLICAVTGHAVVGGLRPEHGAAARALLSAHLFLRKLWLEAVWGMGGVRMDSKKQHAKALVLEAVELALAWHNFQNSVNAGTMTWERDLASMMLGVATAIDVAVIGVLALALSLALCCSRRFAWFALLFERTIPLAVVSNFLRILLALLDIFALVRETGVEQASSACIFIFCRGANNSEYQSAMLQMLLSVLDLHATMRAHHGLRYRRTKYAVRLNEANPLFKLLCQQWLCMVVLCMQLGFFVTFLTYQLQLGAGMLGCCKLKPCYVLDMAVCNRSIVSCSNAPTPPTLNTCGSRWAIAAYEASVGSGGTGSSSSSSSSSTSSRCVGCQDPNFDPIDDALGRPTGSPASDDRCQCDAYSGGPPSQYLCAAQWDGFDTRVACNVEHSGYLKGADNQGFLILSTLTFVVGILPLVVFSVCIARVGPPAKPRALLPPSAFASEDAADVLVLPTAEEATGAVEMRTGMAAGRRGVEEPQAVLLGGGRGIPVVEGRATPHMHTLVVTGRV